MPAGNGRQLKGYAIGTVALNASILNPRRIILSPHINSWPRPLIFSALFSISLLSTWLPCRHSLIPLLYTSFFLLHASFLSVTQSHPRLHSAFGSFWATVHKSLRIRLHEFKARNVTWLRLTEPIRRAVSCMFDTPPTMIQLNSSVLEGQEALLYTD